MASILQKVWKKIQVKSPNRLPGKYSTFRNQRSQERVSLLRKRTIPRDFHCFGLFRLTFGLPRYLKNSQDPADDGARFRDACDVGQAEIGDAVATQHHRGKRNRV